MTMKKERAMTMKTDTASNDPRDYDPLYWMDITAKQLQAKGLIYDRGERRNGQIVWKITPAGRKVLGEQA
jgi:hypothetical protein